MNIEAVEVSFELVIQAQSLIYLIENLPGEFPADVFLYFLYFDYIFSGHVAMGLTVRLIIIPIEFGVYLG